MTSVSATTARSTLYRLIENLQNGQAPVLITGKKGNAVLVSEDDWRAIEETMYLSSIPGMAESIKQGMKEPIESGVDTIDL
ncbi:MAG: prevent-host-death family protein [Candidatus Peribacteria bacterium]|nr:prevent-host-death family protein [Candidatus Peribacteria bacterium]